MDSFSSQRSQALELFFKRLKIQVFADVPERDARHTASPEASSALAQEAGGDAGIALSRAAAELWQA
jgi:hypothetical protein